MKHRITALAALAVVSSTTHAVTVTPTDSATTLTSSFLGASSGLTVVGSPTAFGASTQMGTYTGFSLVPTDSSKPTFTLPEGIVLTSGNAVVPTTNTLNNYSGQPGTPGLPALTTLAGTSTHDASGLNLSFTAGASVNAIKATFLFASDEFPTQSVTDIFGFFVDGVNYAKFPNGELIANKPGSANFTLNPVGSGLYGIEYNGLTNVLTVTGLFDPTLTTHTLTVAIADTSDTIFDSAVYIANLSGTNETGGGGITTPVPEPETYALMLAGLGVVGAVVRRRRLARG